MLFTIIFVAIDCKSLIFGWLTDQDPRSLATIARHQKNSQSSTQKMSAPHNGNS
ncbi:hypothetical protein [Moraxella nasicaprae]|uniref:Uncharacterized protein n=1 Tax=Moraxella nasicaprae TaxID=2904122 RepID=A0ABY6F531_9GAMM|nr:hypothetical protein [Moraxella nasicaprae]UXZ05201.1 hypothetical protein LU297_01745 [Moraxella nasicaprae]